MAKKPTTTTTSRPRKTAAATAPLLDDHGHGAPVAAGDISTISSGMDYAQHEATYRWFGSMVKWGIIACVVLVLFLFIAIHPMVPHPAS